MSCAVLLLRNKDENFSKKRAAARVVWKCEALEKGLLEQKIPDFFSRFKIQIASTNEYLDKKKYAVLSPAVDTLIYGLKVT